jgi:hypothetical protein
MMRIIALYDADGRILAAAAIEGHYRGPVPVASEGTEVGMFDVPESASVLRLDEICTLHRVDPRAKCLVDAKAPADQRRPGRPSRRK